MKQKAKLLLITFLFLPLCVLAQRQVTVKGKVIEAETNEPLPGVTILVEKSTRGVTTDMDGTFEIRVSTSQVWSFSFVGNAIQL